MKRSDFSRIRQQIGKLRVKREGLEKALMINRRRMIDACLIDRRELAGGKLRKTPAFYLSRKVNGRTKLMYVRKDQLSDVLRATDRWRGFSSTLAEWVKLMSRMDKLFRELGKAQLEKQRKG